ncbi:MAG TPA: hypothetical protein DCX06_08200 [Opitutae bacterium]|nr:hypothetical protein [Opitutae bacterium]
MKIKILLGMGFAASFLPLQGQEDKIGETRDVLDQWVETQQIISETKSNWDLERSILQDSESLLTSALERLDEDLEELDQTATAADEERSGLTAEKEVLSAASAVVEDKIGELETKVKAIVATFPEPLVDRIKPLIRRLPKDSSKTKLTMGERVQNIVGILSQADKFNGTITQTSESREIEGGKVIEVRTIYWGLGGAYFVDAAGEYAGVGFPGENGWEWPRIEGAGPEIKRLLDVYEGTGEIQFVEVPAHIK